MTNKRPESNGELKVTMQKALKIEDLVRYLSELVNLHMDPRTGNSELGKGLQVVVNALKPYSNKLICELTDTLPNNFLSKKTKGRQKNPKIELPPNLDSLAADKIDAILNDSDYTKLQIIDLGVQRFGISRSKLAHLNKNRVLESVRAALNHENSLGIISQEARRGGAKRTS